MAVEVIRDGRTGPVGDDQTAGGWVMSAGAGPARVIDGDTIEVAGQREPRNR